jgi:hypothetical protein
VKLTPLFFPGPWRAIDEEIFDAHHDPICRVHETPRAGPCIRMAERATKELIVAAPANFHALQQLAEGLRVGTRDGLNAEDCDWLFGLAVAAIAMAIGVENIPHDVAAAVKGGVR